MSVTATPPGSMYDRIGGGPAVRRVVARLYMLILDDALLRPMFNAVELAGLKAHMAAMLAQLLGGPKEYTGRDLAAVHLPLGLTDEQYQRVDNYLIACLWIEHAPVDVTYTVADVLARLRPDIVADPERPADAAAPGQGASSPTA